MKNLLLSTFFPTFALAKRKRTDDALVAELVDALDLGSSISDVQVRVLSGAQKGNVNCVGNQQLTFF